MKVIFLLLFLTSFLFSSSLDSLLDSYKQESDLSNKTKNESAGNLILYTRDDLDRMQVESLKDILKSLRGYPYRRNRLGQTDIFNQDPISNYSKGIRIYLNENELLHAISGSGLRIFGDIEMDFIDHVEIYQGFPSFEFGVEPATIVIRLYTKSAEHDQGGRVKLNVGTHGSSKQNVYYTNQEDDLKYSVYANHSNENNDKYEHDGETLGRDTETNRFYGSLANANHHLELHAMESKSEAFLSSLFGNIPQSSSIESYYINASLDSRFMDDSLRLNISYINALNDFSSQYNPTKPSLLPINTAPYFVETTSYDKKLKESILTVKLNKKWKVDNQEISCGIQYRDKKFEFIDLKLDGLPQDVSQVYSDENVYSVFIQDMISLNENNLISVSLMGQLYDRIGIEDQYTTQFRLGYIYTNDAWVAKTFISHQEFASEPYMIVSPYYGNSLLEAEVYSAIFQEISYKTPRTLSKLILGHGINENLPILDSNFQIQNAQEDIKSFYATLEFTYLFNKNDKLELHTNYTYFEPLADFRPTNHYHNYIRMLNTRNKFDIFNELVINGGYDYVSTGYDYSAGIKYHVNKDLHINIKGENLLNKSLEQRFVNKITPVLDTIIVPIIERKVTIGMEYLF